MVNHSPLVLKGSMGYWILFATVYLGTQLIDLFTAYWLRTWTAATSEPHPPHTLDYYLILYASLTLAGVLGSATRWIVLYEGVTSRASVLIHRSMSMFQ